MIWRRAVLAVAVLLVACVKDDSPEVKTVSMPSLETETTLRVVHAVNPRLPRLDQAQLERMLSEASRVVREHFGIEVRFVIAGEIGVDRLFDTIPASLWKVAQRYNFDPRTRDKYEADLAKAFSEALSQSGYTLEDLVNFDPARLARLAGKDQTSVGRELARIQLDGLARWLKIVAPDGRPIIDSNPYNQFAFWSVLGHPGLPYDIVVTNQLVASAEYNGTDVHSALRGGLTQGLTSYNKNSPLGTYALVSTFAATASDSWTLELREGETYSAKEIPGLSAHVLAHEIGHQLLHLGHPFGKTECVMNPTHLLQLRRWVQGLSAIRCKQGNYPAMVPGAEKIRYVDWS